MNTSPTSPKHVIGSGFQTSDPSLGIKPTQAGSEGVNATKEEQDQYNIFVDNGLKLLYSKKSFDAILKRLKLDPVEGVASVVAATVARLDESFTQNGGRLDDAVILHGTKELVEVVVDTVESAGIHEYTKEDLTTVMLETMDMLRGIKQANGSLDVEEHTREMATLAEMDRSGALEKEAPELRQFLQEVNRKPSKKPQKRAKKRGR